MKKIMAGLVLFILISGSADAQTYSFKNLVGSWRNKKGMGLDVVDSATIFVVHGTQRRPVTVSADFDNDPVQLSLSTTDSGKVVTLKSLVLFVSDDLLQWQIYDSGSKPVSFGGTHRDMMVLRRVQQLQN